MGARGPVPLSVLDLSILNEGGSSGESLAATTALAARADELGYERFWVAEHHNMPTIASSATAVLVAHVAAHTKTIRVGAGGVMLPNHAPLVVAEQFGTLEHLHPGRIDLGLGRAPGTDPVTIRALRTYETNADSFPRDVVELQAYLSDDSRVEGVHAMPGRGTHVPLYILGSSLFGAQLAAKLGLPYAFASHFAPNALDRAIALYRREFRPSKQSAEPYVIAGVNVVAADTSDEARAQFAKVRRSRVKALLGRGQHWSDDEADEVLDSPAGEPIEQMGKYSAVGTADEVRAYVESFAKHADADELMTVHPTARIEDRLRSIELLASASTSST